MATSGLGRTFNPGDLVVNKTGLHGIILSAELPDQFGVTAFMANGLIEGFETADLTLLLIPGSIAPQSFVELVNNWWFMAWRDKMAQESS